MKILVTGGAGYIGSFMVKRLLQGNHQVIVADSLERGHENELLKLVECKIGNLADKSYRTDLLQGSNIDAIIHFAGYIAVGESMQNAYMYFQNNVATSLQLLEEARQNNIRKIIFSSSAAVYGNPIKTPISEDHPKNPQSPYGESKLMFETILKWYNTVHSVSSVSLRYFNACGAALDGSMGEAHKPETHIIPNAIRSVINNTPFTLFGNDYKTPDGTCIRDYIHVIDLAEAHMLALQKLEKEEGAFSYNVGTGKGYSNKEILDTVKKVSGKDINISTAPRRPGDADILVADASKIETELHFKPQNSDLETIVQSAWLWHKSQSEQK
jgi:UDP-glucose 4-epimerase